MAKKSRMTKLTLKDFQKIYQNDDVCLDWLRNKLYPKKIYCEGCQKPTLHHKSNLEKPMNVIIAEHKFPLRQARYFINPLPH